MVDRVVGMVEDQMVEVAAYRMAALEVTLNFIYLFVYIFVYLPLSRVEEVAYLVVELVDHHLNLHLVVVFQNQLQ